MVRGKQPSHTASRSTGSIQSQSKQSRHKRSADNDNDAALAAATAAAAELAAVERTPEASSSDEDAPQPPPARAAQARNKSNQDSAETLKRKFDELEKENARLRERLEKVRWLCNVRYLQLPVQIYDIFCVAESDRGRFYFIQVGVQAPEIIRAVQGRRRASSSHSAGK